MSTTATLGEGVRQLNQQEIKEASVELASGDTTTSTSGISQVQGEEWLERVLRDAEEQRRFENVSRVNRTLVNQGGDTVHIPRTTGHLDISSTGTSEGSARTYTQLDNIETIDVTVSGNDFKKGGIAIGKETIMTSNVDVVQEARNAVSQELAQEVDEALRSEAVSSASNNVDNSTSGELTPDAISKAMQHIEDNNFEPQWLVVSPGQMHDLRTDSQFTNASEYGNREVVANGEVGTYLGVRVMKSTAITRDANNKAVMIGSTRAGDLVGPTLVWKETPSMAMEYNQEEAEQRIYYDQAFSTTTIHGDAVATIQTA